MSKKRDQPGADINAQFAWKVHDNLGQGTGRADTKASIALAIEVAILGFIISLSGDGKTGSLAELHGWRLTFYMASIAVLCFSIVMSLLTVIPQLRGRATKKEYKGNMIYFGHLRLWEPKDLAKALVTEIPESEQLARQLVNMSKISWRKHVFLQWSLISLVIAGLLLGVTLLIH